jgi:AcrR family transcriptional regulator
LGSNIDQSRETTDKGEQTRAKIVDRAVHLAAVRGLDGFSIGDLAKELDMSKSGLFAHFGSRENLEKAIVERARDLFFTHVLDPVEQSELQGIERLWTLCDNWLSFVEMRVFPGGYFFTGALFQRAGQWDSVSRIIRDTVRRWVESMTSAVDAARKKGELSLDVNARQTALELNGILLGAHCSHLMGYQNCGITRVVILRRLSSLATEKIPADAFDSLAHWRDYLENRHP